MSTPHIAWAFAQRGLTAAQRVVLIALAERANGERTCFPSEETLAADCELSLRSIAAAVKYLSGQGDDDEDARRLIEIVSDKAERAAILAKAGARVTARVNVYRILRPVDGAKTAPTNGHDSAKSAPSEKSYPQAAVVSAKSARSTPSDSAKSSNRACKKRQIEHAPFAHESLNESLHEKRGADAPRQAADLRAAGVSGSSAYSAAAEPEAEPVPAAQRMAAQTMLGKLVRRLESPATRPAGKYPAHSVDEQIASATQKPPTLSDIHPAVLPAVLAARRAMMQVPVQRQPVHA
jgi:hypothetical protein